MKLLRKELSLTAMPISYIFIAFAAMVFIPNYPILMLGFFVCMGIFYSFQRARECNDILYSALLPIAKQEIVRGKFLFTLFIEGCAFLLTLLLVLLRMTTLADAAVYRENALMNGNIAFLGYLLLMFALFNGIFLGGFFKDAHRIGVPFLMFGIASVLLVGLSETLHFLPGLEGLNASGFDGLPLQLAVLLCGIILFAFSTLLTLKNAEKRFEKLDL